MTDDDARRRIDIFHRATTDWVLEGSREVRRRWHNQKYFTWVEQQGKTTQELDAQLSQGWWLAQASKANEIDEMLLAARS